MYVREKQIPINQVSTTSLKERFLKDSEIMHLPSIPIDAEDLWQVPHQNPENTMLKLKFLGKFQQDVATTINEQTYNISHKSEKLLFFFKYFFYN